MVTSKTVETRLEMAILGGNAILKILFKYQFGCFILSVEAIKQLTPKGFILVLSFYSVNCFFLHKTSVICPKYVSMQSFPDSSSVCSEGSALQCIFISE